MNAQMSEAGLSTPTGDDLKEEIDEIFLDDEVLDESVLEEGIDAEL